MDKSRRRSRLSRDRKKNLEVPLEVLLGDDGDIETYFKKNVVVKKPRDVFKKKTDLTTRRSMILPAFQKSIVASTPIQGRRYSKIHNNQWNCSSIGSSLENTPVINYDKSMKSTSKNRSKKNFEEKINVSQRDEAETKFTPKISSASSKPNNMSIINNDEMVIDKKSGAMVIESKIQSNSKIPILKERKLIDSFSGIRSLRGEDKKITSSANRIDNEKVFKKSNPIQNLLKSPELLSRTKLVDDTEGRKDTLRYQDVSLKEREAITRRESIGCNNSNTSKKSDENLENPLEKSVLLCQTNKVNDRRLRKRNETSLHQTEKIDGERVSKCQDASSGRIDQRRYRLNPMTPKIRLSKKKRTSDNITGDSFMLFRTPPAEELDFFSSDNEAENNDIDFSNKPKPSRFSLGAVTHSLNRRSSVCLSGIMKWTMKVEEETSDERSNTEGNVECEKRISLSPTEGEEELTNQVPLNMVRILRGKKKSIENPRTYFKHKPKVVHSDEGQVYSIEERNDLDRQVSDDLLPNSISAERELSKSLPKGGKNMPRNRLADGDKDYKPTVSIMEICPKKSMLNKDNRDGLLMGVDSQTDSVLGKDLINDLTSNCNNSSSTTNDSVSKKKRAIKNRSPRFGKDSLRRSTRIMKQQRKEHSVEIAELNGKNDLGFFSSKSNPTQVRSDERIHSNEDMPKLSIEMVLDKDGNGSLLTFADCPEKCILNKDLVKDLKSSDTYITNELSRSTRFGEGSSRRSPSKIEPCALNQEDGNCTSLKGIDFRKLNKDFVKDLPSSDYDTNISNKTLSKKRRTILKNRSTRFREGTSRDLSSSNNDTKALSKKRRTIYFKNRSIKFEEASLRRSTRIIKPHKEYSVGIIELTDKKDLKLFKDINIEQVNEENIGSNKTSINNTFKGIKLSIQGDRRKNVSCVSITKTEKTQSHLKKRCKIDNDPNSLAVNGVPDVGRLVLLNLPHEELRPLLEHGQHNVTDTIEILDGEGIVPLKYCIPFKENQLTLVRDQFTATEPVNIFGSAQLRHIKILPMNELHFNNSVKYDQLLKVVRGRGHVKVDTTFNIKVFHTIVIPKGISYTIYNREKKKDLLIRSILL